MKKRYLYALLFGIPGFFLAGFLSLGTMGALLGILWLFVFGDDPWPVAPEKMLAVLMIIIFLIIWVATIAFGYLVGKKQEVKPESNWSHVFLSAGITLLFLVVIGLRLADLGPKPDTVRCSDYCVGQGFSGSGMPPQNSGDRTCSCYDTAGNTVHKIPLGEIK
jgi:hypothetical protein